LKLLFEPSISSLNPSIVCMRGRGMLKMIKNTMQICILFLICFYPNWSYSQCQASLSNDSGLSNYRDGQLPTNMVQPKQDWRYSLYENIKKDNIDISAKVLGLLTVLLMFFSFFANRKKILRIGLAVYAAPMIIYYISFEKMQLTSLVIIIMLTLMMFIWGTCFNFNLKYSKAIYTNLMTWVLMGISLTISVLYFKPLNAWNHVQQLNLYLVSNANEQLILFHVILLLGGIVAMLVHYSFNQVIKPTLNDISPNKTHPSLGVKTVLFLLWVGTFLYAKPLGVYLLTIFFLGNIFREKEIVDDMMVGIKKYRLFFIFSYVLMILFGCNAFIKSQLAYDKVLVMAGIIALICLLYFAVILILKKIFINRIDLLLLMSVNPFFMLSFVLFSSELVTTSLKNFFYMSSIVTVMALAFMV